MNKNITITKADLIKGDFDPEDANDIIFALFTSKINFHSLQAFGIEERTGVEPQTHVKRAKELQNDLNMLRQVITEAKQKDARLRIKGEITLEFLEPVENV